MSRSDTTRTFATIQIDDIGSPRGIYSPERVIRRPFFYCDDGTKWAVPTEHQRGAMMRAGARVIIEITSPDDQYASLVSYV